MAVISPIHGEMSGSIAGNTWSRNRGGQYVRQRTTPVNPTSSRQTVVRGLLSSISREWDGLTEAEQEAWSNWASLNPIPNALGTLIQLTGEQAYIRINMQIRSVGLSSAAAVTAPPVGTAPAGIISAAGALTAATGVLALAYTVTPLGAGERLVAYATLPTGPGRNPNRRQARWVTTTAAAAASPQNITLPWPVAVDEVVNFYLAVLSVDGLISPTLKYRVTAT